MSKEPVPYIPSPRSTPPGGRRRFSKSDKKRIVAGPAPPRGIGLGRGPLVRDNCAATVPLEAGSGAGGADRDDLSTRDAHGYTGSIGGGFPSVLGPVPVIVERAAPGIEVELIGASHHRPSCGGHLGGLLINRSEMILISDKPPWKKQL